MLTMGKGQLRPILIKDVKFTVDIVLHQQQNLLRHLLAIAVDQLDAVIVVGIVAGGDHNTTVEIIHPGDVGHGGSGCNVQQVGICAGCGQTCDQAVLEHIRAAAGILADYNACRLVVAVALTEHIVIPAQKTTNLIGMISGQSDSSFTTEAISSKILPYYVIVPSSKE